MKLAEFHDLCEREWESRRGDILDLHLTNESREELTVDVLLNGAQSQMILYITKEDIETIRGGAITCVVNPITRTAVKLASGAPWDSATVHIPLRKQEQGAV